MKPIDMHVHIVGTGAGGTGCWLRHGGWRWPLERLMFGHIGLPYSPLQGDFDRLYVERLLELVRDSSLGAAVILAMDNVYNDDGTIREGFRSFYVPNEYVLILAGKYPDRIAGVVVFNPIVDLAAWHEELATSEVPGTSNRALR